MSSLADAWTWPGLRVVARLGPLRVLRVLAAMYVIGFTIAVLLRESVDPLATGRDPITYLAAGERLNAGHPLYSLTPGDRPVPLSPPYWSVPLLAPPFIAVVWRPLALLGEPAALAWWIGGVLAIAALTAWLVRRGSAPVLVATVVLTPALALTALSGNASAYLIPLLAVAWWQRGRAWVAAPIVVAAAAIKLAPALFLVWLLATGRSRAVAAAGVAATVVLALSFAGAGLDNHLTWLAVVPSSSPMPLSISAWSGVPSLVIAVAVALAALVATVSVGRRHRDAAGYAAAAIGAALATPAFYFAAIASLVLAVLPTAATSRDRA